MATTNSTTEPPMRVMCGRLEEDLRYKKYIRFAEPPEPRFVPRSVLTWQRRRNAPGDERCS